MPIARHATAPDARPAAALAESNGTPHLAAPSTMRRAAPVVVVALHLLLWLGLQSGLQRDKAPPATIAPGRIELWLARPVVPAPTPATTAPRPPNTRPASKQPVPERDGHTTPDAAADHLATTEAAPPTTNPAAPVAATPTPGRSTLILSLPTQAASAPRHPALDDPRANTRRLTVEGRIARTLDNEEKIELLYDGSRRIRRGTKCTEVHLSRNGQVDPINDSFRGAPSGENSYECN